MAYMECLGYNRNPGRLVVPVLGRVDLFGTSEQEYEMVRVYQIFDFLAAFQWIFYDANCRVSGTY